MIPALARFLPAGGLYKLLAYIGGAALVIAVLWALLERGNRYRDKLLTTQAAFAKTVLDYHAAAIQRKASDLANVERVEVAGSAISEDTLHAYEDRLASLRADYAERVRTATAANSRGDAGADLPGVSEAASGVDARPGEARLPPRDALTASEQAEQLIALQDWVVKVSAIDVNGAP